MKAEEKWPVSDAVKKFLWLFFYERRGLLKKRGEEWKREEEEKRPLCEPVIEFFWLFFRKKEFPKRQGAE